MKWGGLNGMNWGGKQNKLVIKVCRKRSNFLETQDMHEIVILKKIYGLNKYGLFHLYEYHEFDKSL